MGREASIGGEPVLVLHGLWMNRLAMHYLVLALRRAGFGAASVGYRSASETLEQHVAALARRVAATEGEGVHLAGHSFGGLVILRYLQGTPDPRVRRAVLLGAPVSGCLMAERLGAKAAFLLGGSASAWRSPLDTSLDPRFEVGAIAGTRRFGLGRLLVQLPAPSDGVVLLEETRLPAMRDHLTLPVSHSAMLVSRRVASQTASFLRDGRFSR